MSIRKITIEQLRAALNLRDLSNPAEGPHAMQMIMEEVLSALKANSAFLFMLLLTKLDWFGQLLIAYIGAIKSNSPHHVIPILRRRYLVP